MYSNAGFSPSQGPLESKRFTNLFTLKKVNIFSFIYLYMYIYTSIYILFFHGSLFQMLYLAAIVKFQHIFYNVYTYLGEKTKNKVSTAT
ncbi:hypothetical protein GDO81_016036 [Engystomops pustulosus]|uniref:ATP synthase F0 subunit 8 n=1 Tax=Engystomops pustulosus TaxID=76066 RepID=A0AAV7APZ5_ENGPU|nr:hypothetical protein GDO81_016036 [Engystomops pustulosus]